MVLVCYLISNDIPVAYLGFCPGGGYTLENNLGGEGYTYQHY